MLDLAPYGIDSQGRDHAPARQTLLVVYAHPDDESFGNAGTLARYSAQGVAVHYACATRGECGTVDPRFLQGHDDIAALRTAELTCAAAALDLRAVHYLGYRDSGMPGAPDNSHPDALVAAPPARVTGQVVALIRALRPQVVLTFGPYGGYGHPDHIRIHEVTLAAFRQAADATCYPEQVAAGLAPWRPRKLYYSAFSPGVLRVALVIMRLLRRDTRHFGENGDIDLERAVAESTAISTKIDCGAYLPAIERAMRCHASQLGGMSGMLRLPRPLLRLLRGNETFTRVVPPARRRRIERDLFAGLRR
ncbi:MAG TPA: PIG-L family deacetylase [Chloroflexia bacterium]|nr:PIG-L family deacetylase [Chloroflexia bacterium]